MMKRKKVSWLVIGVLLLTMIYMNSTNVSASTMRDDSPKHEMRAAWISTVVNIDLRPGMNEMEYREWAESSIKELERKNFNTVVFQVKPTSDAFYPSELAPWSKYITGGEQGTDPGYDPLQIMLDITHDYGMELHAWINPYRVTMPSDTLEGLHEDNFAVKHPEWVVHHGSQYYLDPGIPEVQDYLVDTVEELVINYDIDAVHMDDYFYPGVGFADDETFAEYGADFEDKDDWRRDNVGELVKNLNRSIKAIKPWVQFGISPSGIWRNVSEDPTGSETDGQGHYDALFADSRHWIQEELIDYITPQIYWSRDLAIASYSVLLDWWSHETEAYDVNLYIGMADYKVANNFDEAWNNPYELPEQVVDNRHNGEIKGQMHFTLGDIFANRIGYGDIMEEEIYHRKALTPEIPWNGSEAPEKPAAIEITRQTQGVNLQIDPSNDDTRKFVIYRSEVEEEIDYSDPANIVGVVYHKEDDVSFLDVEADPEQLYTYGVTAISNTGVESVDAAEAGEGMITQMKSRVELLTDEGEIVDASTAEQIDMQLTAIDHYAETGKEEKAVKHMNHFNQLLDVLQDEGMITEKASLILQQYADFLIGGWE